MNPELFNLDFSRWEIILLSLMPALINFCIFLYISLSLPQNRTTTSFSIFIFLFGLWQIGDGFVKMSPTAEIALEWYKLSGIFISFIISFGLLFVFCFTKRNKNISDNLKFGFFFLPAIICAFFIAARLDKYTVIKSQQWYWIVNPEPTIITYIVYLWISLGGLIMLVMLWAYYAKVKGNEIKRKQSLLLAAGFSIPFIGGIIAEVIVPLLFEKNDVPITNSLLTVFSITSLVAIKKYKMLEYSPKHQWFNIMESMNEGVVIVNNDDRIMYANKVFCELLGYEFEEINHKIANQLFFDNEGDQKKIKQISVERKKKISSQYEIQLKKKTNEKIWVMASGSPYIDRKGDVIGSIAILTNIDRLKQTENALRHKEENLLKSLEKLEWLAEELQEAQAIGHIGNWELDFETGKATWSDETCRIYGLLPGENEQSFESWIAFTHPEDLDSVNNVIKKSHELFCDSSFYHRIVSRDGTIKYIHSVSKFKFDNEKKPIGMYGICKDITELKKSEEKLKAIHEELKIFIYKSSHDLRSPLASVLGLINVSRMDLTDPKALKYINTIGGLCKNLDSILVKLVEGMSLKDKKLLIEPVDMNQLLDEIFTSLNYIEGCDKITFNVDNKLISPIQTNRDSMYSIMLNLIENSIKYRKQNSSENEIKIGIFRDGKGRTVIEIADNGIGIMEEIKDKVFNMFYRATSSAKGSGLGLYLAKTTVEKLGGQITVESKEGVETKFTVTLPCEMKNHNGEKF